MSDVPRWGLPVSEPKPSPEAVEAIIDGVSVWVRTDEDMAEGHDHPHNEGLCLICDTIRRDIHDRPSL